MKTRFARLYIFMAVVTAILLIVTSALYTVGARLEKVQTVGAGTRPRELPIYSVAREDKKIAISFDCAWGVDYTDKLLEIMEKNDIRCTFFAVQFWVEKYPEYAQKIVDFGHELGTHSRTHSYMSKQTEKEIMDELTTSSDAIEKATGVRPTLFRAPFGDYDDLVVTTAKKAGLYTIQWDVDSLDWKNLSATEIALRVVNGVKAGSIILCHNNGLHTSEALPMILSTLRAKGFAFVPIGELIYKTDYEIDANGVQRRRDDYNA
jgi:polysaccharide deacetylase family sporulation protein PdaB